MKKTKLITLIIIAATAVTAHADDNKRKREHKESHNWIIERQQAGSVSSGDVPIIRRIRGSREIDIYRGGSMFEKNNFVGYDKR